MKNFIGKSSRAAATALFMAAGTQASAEAPHVNTLLENCWADIVDNPSPNSAVSHNIGLCVARSQEAGINAQSQVAEFFRHNNTPTDASMATLERSVNDIREVAAAARCAAGELDIVQPTYDSRNRDSHLTNRSLRNRIAQNCGHLFQPSR